MTYHKEQDINENPIVLDTDNGKDAEENEQETNGFEKERAKNSKEKMFYKTFDFKLNAYSDNVNKTGRKFSGYASTYGNVDLAGDTVVKGAFDKCLRTYKRLNQSIPVFFQHNLMAQVGGIKCDQIESVEKGLHVKEGEILDESDKCDVANQVAGLLKKDFIHAMSIGFSVDDYEIRKNGNVLLKEIFVHEISLVSHPADPKAQVTGVKSIKEQMLDYGEPITAESLTMTEFDKYYSWITCKKDVEYFLSKHRVSFEVDEVRKSCVEKLRNAGFSRHVANVLVSIYRKEQEQPVQTIKKNNGRELKSFVGLIEKLDEISRRL